MSSPTASRAGWDVLGLVVTGLVMLGAQRLASHLIGTPLGHPPGVGPVAVAGAVMSVALLAALVVRDRPRARDLPHLVTRVWTDRPGDWVAAALGALLALPLLSLYTPVLLGDADSARVVAAVDHVRAHGIGFVLETQDNLLPYLVVGPAVALGGVAGAKVVALASVAGLAAVTCYLTVRISGSLAGGAASVLALLALPPVVDRAGFVPMYPAMLAFGYLGIWLAYRAVTETRRQWAWAAAAGGCLVLAAEAQGVGVLFLPVPVVLVVLVSDWRRWLAGCGRIYLWVAVAGLPRLAINLAVGGPAHFASFRTDYWITKGYVRQIQSQFWLYRGVDEPLRHYLLVLPQRFARTLEPQGWVVLGIALVAWVVACRARGRLLVMGVVGLLVVAVSVKQVPPFPRYYSPLWPGLAILAGVGVAALARERHRHPVVTGVTVVCVAVLAGLFGSTLVTVARSHNSQRAVVEAMPYRELAAVIDDDRGIIGARSHSLLNVTTRTPAWGGQFLTEDEYATYLTWPSDDAVIEMMDSHDIGWVLVHRDLRLETSYHDIWLVPNHGRPARHVERIAASPRFCLAADISGFKLYRLRPPAPDAASPSPSRCSTGPNSVHSTS